MTGPTPSGKAQSGLSRRVQTAGVRRTLALATHMDVHTPVDIGTDFLGYRIEELIGCPVALVSTSPEREDTILVRDPFAD